MQGCHLLRPEKSISLDSAPRLPRLLCLVLIPLLVLTGLGAGSAFSKTCIESQLESPSKVNKLYDSALEDGSPTLAI